MSSEVNKIRLTVLIALLFSTLCAGVFRTPPILFMAALLLSAPCVGWLLSRVGSRALRVQQALPETGTVGETVAGRISVCNTGRAPAFLVHAQAGVSQAEGKNYAPIEPLGREHVAPFLRGKTSASWSQQWLLRRRGVHAIEGARAGARDPLGIMQLLPARSQTHVITVLPRPLKLEKLGFFGGQGFEQHAPQHAVSTLDAMDFHGVRLWQPGEAIRRAHWKYTARTGQLHVIEWEETPTIDLAIFLDTCAGAIAARSTPRASNNRNDWEQNGLASDDCDDDDLPDTLEVGIVAAASIACHLLENSCRVEIFFFAPETGTSGTGTSGTGTSGTGTSGTGTSNARKPNAKKPDAQNGALSFGLKKLAARGVAGRETILRALAEIEPVHAQGSDLEALIRAARPQVSRGLSTLAITSSRAPLDAALRGGASGEARANPAARIHAFVIDAESFAQAAPEPDDGDPDAVRVSPRARRAAGRRAYGWKRGQSLAATLEGA